MEEVGFVVIGKDEGEKLVLCLASIRRQVGHDAQIVYVDSGSKDASIDNARQAGCRIVELDLSISFTAARARNVGFDALLEGGREITYTHFIDGDCELEEEWLKAALVALRSREELSIICGLVRERNPQLTPYNMFCQLEWDQTLGDLSACGGIFIINSERFVEAGRFDQTIAAGEEPELCARLISRGGKIARLNHPMAIHDADLVHFGQWWRRMIRNGKGTADIVGRFKAASHRREYRSAIFWAGIWPLSVVLGAFLLALLHSSRAELVLVTILALFPLQIFRIASRHKPSFPSWRQPILYGLLIMVSKLPTLYGILRHNMTRKGEAVRQSGSEQGETMISPWQADLRRYPHQPFFKEQSVWALAVYRFGRWNDMYNSGLKRKILVRIYWLAYRVVETVTGISIPKGVSIGPGLRIWHFGNIVVHENVVIGANCTLRQGITIGNREANGAVPTLEDDVEVGAYAQILGKICIGKGAKIGAMSVVLHDVPPGATAVGFPARIIQKPI